LNFFWLFSGLGRDGLCGDGGAVNDNRSYCTALSLTEGAVIGAILDFERPEKNDHPRSGYL
jgi:hypothetical protein